ncbi:D-hexose-6-phosphate mutarotase [Tessaracoccus sp.]
MIHEVTSNPLTGIEARPGSGHYGVYDHGAHVWAWQPSGHKPVLWTSQQSMYESGQAIRGGVPVIFPWFGTGSSGTLTPPHGFARLHTWQRTLVDDTTDVDGKLVVEYRMDHEPPGPHSGFSHAFAISLRVVFSPDHLEVGMEVSNAGEVPFTFEEAFHTYLAVGDVGRISIDGLEGANYLDRVAGASRVECVQDGPVAITSETDRLYGHSGDIVLDDPAWGRQLKITKEGSANTVVWNPWIAKSAVMPDFGEDEWGSMVCIEAANLLDNAITLEPGHSHLMRQRISLVGMVAGQYS